MVTALRLASGARVAAGPLLFEAVDGAHRSVRALPPLAAATPHGDAVRLDANSLATARALCGGSALLPRRCGSSSRSRSTRPASSRREASIGRLASSLAILRVLLDGERVGDHSVALRVAALRGPTAGERVRIVERLSYAAAGADGRHVELPPEELELLEGEIDGRRPRDVARGPARRTRERGSRRRARRRAARVAAEAALRAGRPPGTRREARRVAFDSIDRPLRRRGRAASRCSAGCCRCPSDTRSRSRGSA